LKSRRPHPTSLREATSPIAWERKAHTSRLALVRSVFARSFLASARGSALAFLSYDADSRRERRKQPLRQRLRLAAQRRGRQVLGGEPVRHFVDKAERRRVAALQDEHAVAARLPQRRLKRARRIGAFDEFAAGMVGDGLEPQARRPDDAGVAHEICDRRADEHGERADDGVLHAKNVRLVARREYDGRQLLRHLAPPRCSRAPFRAAPFARRAA
jgi:hypothetical protein